MGDARDSWKEVVRNRKPSIHRKIQQLLEELKEAGWDEEALTHLGRVFYEFAGNYHRSATKRFNVPSESAWKDVEILLENMGKILSGADFRLYPKNHRTWVRKVLKSVKVPSSPPVSAWYLQNLMGMIVNPLLIALPTLRDGILKAVRRGDLDAFHKLNLLISHSSPEDLDDLEFQAAYLLVDRGRKTFPRHKVGQLVNELLVKHAVYRLARLVDHDVGSVSFTRHVEVLNRLFAEHGASFHPEEIMKLPLVTLAGVLAVEGRQLEGKRIDPRYFLFFKALAAKSVPNFVESLLREAPAWVHLIDETVVPQSNPNIKIILSKKDLVSQAQALERFPTCHTPLYGEHADKLLFTSYASGVVPVVAVAKELSSDKVIGRVNVLFDENVGNVYITSLPLGKVGMEQYMEAVEAVARQINKKLGQTKFKRIVVGDLSGKARMFLLKWGVHDAHVIEGRGPRKGRYYFIGRIARHLE